MSRISRSENQSGPSWTNQPQDAAAERRPVDPPRADASDSPIRGRQIKIKANSTYVQAERLKYSRAFGGRGSPKDDRLLRSSPASRTNLRF